MAAVFARRPVFTASCVGVAAGTLGTWFETSHGVFCIPVLTLPPMALSHQVAAGSTVFGVAVRHSMSVALYAADPSEPFSEDNIHELVDVNATLALAASGTVTALLAAALSAKTSYTRLRRLNGLLMMFCGGFMHWRDQMVRELGKRSDKDLEELDEGGNAAAVVVTPEGNVKVTRPDEFSVVAGPVLGPGNLPRTEEEVAKLVLEYDNTPVDKLRRFVLLGAMSGVLLGYFGVGPAWMLAPILTRTSPEWDQIASKAPGAEDDSVFSMKQFMPLPAFKDQATDPAEGPKGPLALASDLISSAGCDERTRRTCSLGMVAPCLAAAWRHYSLGHVVDPSNIAYPLAAGAILGSFVTGKMMGDTPPDEHIRFGLSVIIFAYGAWAVLGPR